MLTAAQCKRLDAQIGLEAESSRAYMIGEEGRGIYWIDKELGGTSAR